MSKKIKSIFVAFNDPVKNIDCTEMFEISMNDVEFLEFHSSSDRISINSFGEYDVIHNCNEASIILKESANRVLETINNKPYTVFDRFLEKQDLFSIDLYDENNQFVETFMFEKDSTFNHADNPFQKSKIENSKLCLYYKKQNIIDQDEVDNKYI